MIALTSYGGWNGGVWDMNSGYWLNTDRNGKNAYLGCMKNHFYVGNTSFCAFVLPGSR